MKDSEVRRKTEMKTKRVILVLVLVAAGAALLGRYRLEWVRFIANSSLPGRLKMILFGWF